MTESTAIIDTPLSAGEVAEELEGSWLLQETTQPECAHKPSEG